MATREELSAFLAGVERRAFKQAVFAVRDESHALDIVQDAMMKIAENYGDRPAAELPLIFTRILQNAIHDFFRRAKVRSTWVTLFSALTSNDEPDADPLETLDASGDARAESTETAFEREQIVGIIEEEVARLLGADRLIFQDLEDLIDAVQKKGKSYVDRFDCSVFNGEYITGDVTPEYLRQLEESRSDEGESADERADGHGSLRKSAVTCVAMTGCVR